MTAITDQNLSALLQSLPATFIPLLNDGIASLDEALSLIVNRQNYLKALKDFDIVVQQFASQSGIKTDTAELLITFAFGNR
jgi:hypothetical protein